MVCAVRSTACEQQLQLQLQRKRKVRAWRCGKTSEGLNALRCCSMAGGA